MLLHTALQWQQQNINQTLNSQNVIYMYHVQAMECLLWGSGENYIVIISSNFIWIFLNHNSLRPNDASVSYIIIGWDNGFSLARRQASSKLIVSYTYCQFGLWNKRVKLKSKTTFFYKEHFNDMKMSSAKCRLFRLGLSAWLVDMIWRRCK